MIRIEVHEGLSRRLVEVAAESVRIGRDANCELLLSGDPRVSRAHAELRRERGRWHIADLGSRNGTSLNGRRLTTVQAVNPGDRIAIGNYVLVIGTTVSDIVETIDATDGDLARLRIETGLSSRELEILRLVAGAKTDAQIAQELVISVKTVRSHLDRIRDKTGCRRRVELLGFARDHGVS